MHRVKVLVIGSGGAGLRAALAASDALTPSDVLLVSRGVPGRSGVTALAYSDRMAFHVALPGTPPGGPESWRAHADDIYRLGGEVSDFRLAETLAAGGAAAFDYLVSLGVPFARRADGTPEQFITDGSLYPRACYTGPDTGVQIERALLNEFTRTGIRALSGWSLAAILAENGETAGAVFVSGDNRLLAVSAPAVILATGGPGGVYSHNAFPGGMTGEGHSAALLAGARLVNMEFIQLGLCSVATRLACSGSLFRALPRVVDDDGKEFLDRFIRGGRTDAAEILFRKGASWPVSAEEPTFIMDVAAAQLMNEGRRVFLDYRSDSGARDAWGVLDFSRYHSEGRREIMALSRPLDRLAAVNPQVIEWFLRRGIDLAAGDVIQIAPSAQHFQGGVHIGTRAETAVPGLFACGEAAGGQHGANRPGGNALLDTQVMGRIAGESAAALVRGAAPGTAAVPSALADELATYARLDPRHLAALLAEVRSAVQSAAGVIRRSSLIDDGIRRLSDVASRMDSLRSADASPGAAMLALAVRSAVHVGRCIMLAAAGRNESRGPHLRFPEDSLDPLPKIPAFTGKWFLERLDRSAGIVCEETACPG
ncbi:MAG: FAD-binding protein [Planctomycetes bacterium]|nr:FAD-binding protein [Planctomycetota bacterium]